METLKLRRSLYTAEEEDLLQQERGPSTGGIEDLLRGEDLLQGDTFPKKNFENQKTKTHLPFDFFTQGADLI
jgi:hypothetical protein